MEIYYMLFWSSKIICELSESLINYVIKVYLLTSGRKQITCLRNISRLFHTGYDRSPNGLCVRNWGDSYTTDPSCQQFTRWTPVGDFDQTVLSSTKTPVQGNCAEINKSNDQFQHLFCLLIILSVKYQKNVKCTGRFPKWSFVLTTWKCSSRYFKSRKYSHKSRCMNFCICVLIRPQSTALL